MSKSSKRPAPTDDSDDDVGPMPAGAAGAVVVAAADDDDNGPMPAPAAGAAAARVTKPKKKKVVEFEKLFLEDLPMTDMYERSFMHRDVITHVVATATDFLVTASSDGHLKFWKKIDSGIEFVKHFRAHLKPIGGLAASADGTNLVTTSSDKFLKVFDVTAFDMVNMLRVDFVPTVVDWVYSKGQSPTFACGDANSPTIRVFSASSTSTSSDGLAQPLRSIDTGHGAPVTHLRFNPVYKVCVSFDTRGMIEYWDPVADNGDMPVSFQYKTETDMYEFAKCKTTPLSLDFSADGKLFACLAADRQVRVFTFLTGKLRRKYDESLKALQEVQQSGDHRCKVDSLDFGRRLAGEKELDREPSGQNCNAVFDKSGHFLYYPTPLGVKLVNITTNTLVKIIGQGETSERFMGLSLHQSFSTGHGAAKALPSAFSRGSDNTAAGEGMQSDPTLITTAYKKKRFYMFSRREPEELDDGDVGRDVFNEKPSKDELAMVPSTAGTTLPQGVTIHTSLGDITCRLFGAECPMTVENLSTHAKNGYYNGITFHRIIKNFMLQTGDPLGDGTGGESIWGGEFKDEFHRSLRHDRPYTLSMANAGPGTNGSQFFITTVPCTWLDNKHTVFGRVVRGMETCQTIEKVKTEKKTDRPFEPPQIINMTLHDTLDED